MRRHLARSRRSLTLVLVLAAAGCASSGASAGGTPESRPSEVMPTAAPLPSAPDATTTATPSITPSVSPSASANTSPNASSSASPSTSTDPGANATARTGPSASVQRASAATRASLRADAGEAVDDEKALGGRRGRRTLAVLPFEPADTAVEELAVGFAELIMADLAVFPQLNLLERARLDDVLAEQGLDTARIDASSAIRVGRLIAAQRLVNGGIASLGDTGVHFEVGVVNVGTSVVTAAFEGHATADGIFEAEQLVVQRLAVALGLAVPPELAARMQARRRYKAEVFRHFARAARLEADGEYEAAATMYENATRLAPDFEVAHAKRAFVRQWMASPARRAAMRRHRRARMARPAAAAAKRAP